MSWTTNVAVRALLLSIGIAGIPLALVGCDNLLKVSNPSSLQEAQLDDPALEGLLVNGAIAEFQYAFTNYAFFSAVLADEAFLDHPNVNFREFALHSFTDLNTTNELVYSSLQQARQSADDAVDRIKRITGQRAGSSLSVARALIYGGYAYVLLAEGFCEAPVNLSAALPSQELFARAIARFDEGIAVATAAMTGPNVIAAEDLVFMARVGAARASLKKGDPIRARAYATNVPATYERWAYYSANSAREYNAVQIAVRASQPWLGIQSSFQSLADARVPSSAARPSLRSMPISPPLKPSSYSGWAANAAAPIELASDVRFASGLEAQYIVIESDGPSPAMLAFVNTRRVIGGKPPVSLSGPALVTEFRVQRALDFYLTGQRLGDLRRYADAGTNLFPGGKYPTLRDFYGTMSCFIVPLSEKAANPNY